MAATPQPGTALKRPIRDGRAYDHLFPRATGLTDTVKRNASLQDTLRKLPQVVREYDWQCKKLAKKLQGRTVYECAENIYNFCYGNIQYERDEEGTEQIRTPARSWRDRKEGIDCDCFSVLVSCTLRQMRDPRSGRLGIPHKFRVVKYPDPDEPNPPYSHIYVVVHDPRGEIAIDPVADMFDYEHPYLKKREVPMDLQVLNGPPGALGGIDQSDLFGEELNGLGSKVALKTSKAPPPPAVSSKMERIKREAAARGMTLEQYKAFQRQEFIKKHGMTPEQWAAQVRAKIAASQQAGAEKDAEDRAKLMRELDKRGAAYDRNASRQELLDILRGTKKPGVGGKIVNAINKVNPATVLLRTGVLLLLKANFQKIAEKLRYGFLSEGQARGKRLDRGKHAKVKRVNDKLRKIYFAAGGKPEKYKEAILRGKGNRDRDVALAGFPTEPFGDFGELDGLGEPVSATAAIAAATATMTAIAALLKSIGNMKSSKPGDPAANERTAGTDGQEPGKAEKFLNNLTNFTTAAGGALDTFNQIKNGGGADGNGLIVRGDGMPTTSGEMTDFSGDFSQEGGEEGGNQGGGENKRQANSKDKLIKAGLIVGGVAAAAGIGFLIYKSTKGASKPTAALAGKPTPKPKTSPRNGASRKRKAASTNKANQLEAIPVP